MNKKLILKYKPEFDHWLNGGKLQANFVYDQWVEAPKDIFSYNMVNFVLVIDDEYIEFRRALAEGKTIQLNEAEKFSDPKRGWVDLSCDSLGSSTNLFPVEYYRIKPEEPKFKVGDWVRAPSGYIYQINETNILHGTKHFIPWQPKKDELFWGTRTVHLDYQYETRIELFQVKNVHADGTLSLISPLDKNVYSLWIQPEDLQEFMKAAEPFIGQLPTFFKENA